MLLLTGKSSSSGRNIFNSEEVSYIKNQQRDPRSTCYSPSFSYQEEKRSPAFGYAEEKNETGLHTSGYKRSVAGNLCFLNE